MTLYSFAQSLPNNLKQMEITFESLPKAVTLLTNEVSEIKRLLLEKSNEHQTNPDRWFDLQELRNYLPDKPATATVYSWVHAGILPFHKGSKRLRFRKSEIDNWLMKGGKKTNEEIEQEAHTNLLKSKSGGIK